MEPGSAYLTRLGMHAYVEDLLEMVSTTARVGSPAADGEDAEGDAARMAFAAAYFQQLAEGNHVHMRGYAFVVATAFNVSTFIIRYRTLLRHMLQTEVSADACVSVARHLAPDFSMRTIEVALTLASEWTATGTGRDADAEVDGPQADDAGGVDAFVRALEVVMRHNRFVERCMDKARTTGSLVPQILLEMAASILGMSAEHAEAAVDAATERRRRRRRRSRGGPGHQRQAAEGPRGPGDDEDGDAKADGGGPASSSPSVAEGDCREDEDGDIRTLAVFLDCCRARRPPPGGADPMEDLAFVSRLIEVNAARARRRQRVADANVVVVKRKHQSSPRAARR